MGIWNGYSPTYKAKTRLWSPYAGFDATKGSHWAWVFLTIIAGILTIPAFLAGFIPGVLMWVFVMELQPEEMADALSGHPNRIANKKDYEKERTEYVQWITEQKRIKAIKKYGLEETE
jgi:hypothetical protein